MDKYKIDEWFDALSPKQQVPLQKLRTLILKAESGIVEEIKWGQPCYKLNKHFCYLQKAKDHVTLGFQQGAHLAGAATLAGEGKDMRHIHFALDEEIDGKRTALLISQAIQFDRQQFDGKV